MSNNDKIIWGKKKSYTAILYVKINAPVGFELAIKGS